MASLLKNLNGDLNTSLNHALGGKGGGGGGAPVVDAYMHAALTSNLSFQSNLMTTTPTLTYNCASVSWAWNGDTSRMTEAAINTPIYQSAGIRLMDGMTSAGAYGSDLSNANWTTSAGSSVNSGVVHDLFGTPSSGDTVSFTNIGDYIEYDNGLWTATNRAVTFFILNNKASSADFDIQLLNSSTNADVTDPAYPKSHSLSASEDWTLYHTGSDTSSTTKKLRITAQTAGAELGIAGIGTDLSKVMGSVIGDPGVSSVTLANGYLTGTFVGSELPVNDFTVEITIQDLYDQGMRWSNSNNLVFQANKSLNVDEFEIEMAVTNTDKCDGLRVIKEVANSRVTYTLNTPEIDITDTPLKIKVTQSSTTGLTLDINDGAYSNNHNTVHALLDVSYAASQEVGIGGAVAGVGARANVKDFVWTDL